MHKSPSPVRNSRMKQARSEEGENRGRDIGKTEVRRLMERKAAQQNKNLSEELKQGLYLCADQVNNAGRGTHNLSYPQNVSPYPTYYYIMYIISNA